MQVAYILDEIEEEERQEREALKPVTSSVTFTSFRSQMTGLGVELLESDWVEAFRTFRTSSYNPSVKEWAGYFGWLD